MLKRKRFVLEFEKRGEILESTRLVRAGPQSPRHPVSAGPRLSQTPQTRLKPVARRRRPVGGRPEVSLLYIPTRRQPGSSQSRRKFSPYVRLPGRATVSLWTLRASHRPTLSSSRSQCLDPSSGSSRGLSVHSTPLFVVSLRLRRVNTFSVSKQVVVNKQVSLHEPFTDGTRSVIRCTSSTPTCSDG